MIYKKIIIFSILAAILIAACIRIISGEDDWICVNNEWIKHGNPSSSKPETGCGELLKESDIIVTSPRPDELIKSPLTVEGKARGNWFFEAVFPAKILDDKGNEIGRSQMQAASDWMTADFVPFKGEVIFANGKIESGTIVLEKDNPSGLPQNAGKIEIPVRFAPGETIKVKAYFNNSKMDLEISCNKVFPVEREIAKTPVVAHAALEELLKGPTDKEKESGFFTGINPGVKIQKLTIENGVARVDFDAQLEFQVGGSCKVSAIRAEITQTLKQFPTIKNVVISINGRTEDILQP